MPITFGHFRACRRAGVLTAIDPTTVEIRCGDYYKDFAAENRRASLDSKQVRGLSRVSTEQLEFLSGMVSQLMASKSFDRSSPAKTHISVQEIRRFEERRAREGDLQFLTERQRREVRWKHPALPCVVQVSRGEIGCNQQYDGVVRTCFLVVYRSRLFVTLCALTRAESMDEPTPACPGRLESGRGEAFRGGSSGSRSAGGAGRGASRAPCGRLRHLSSS